MARCRYKHMRRLRLRAVIVIHAMFRMWRLRSWFLGQHQVAVVEQRMFRRLVRGRGAIHELGMCWGRLTQHRDRVVHHHHHHLL
jgi:hypothetical protein